MKKIKEISNTLFALLIVGAFFFIVWVFIKEIGILIIKGIEKISNITSNMDSVVIVALITGTISIVSVLISSIISKVLEYKQVTNRYLYEKRETPYKDFISMIYKLQGNSKKGYTQEEMLKDIASFSELLTMWGSSEVIKKWIKFRDMAMSEEDTGTLNLFLLEDIMFEIRKDMGQKNKGLKVGDMLSFFVNDIKKYLPNKNSKSKMKV